MLPARRRARLRDAYDKLLRAAEASSFARDLLAAPATTTRRKIANDQNEVVEAADRDRLDAPLPTFIVGLYGQNFDHMPELNWATATRGRGPDHRHDHPAARVLPPEALDLGRSVGVPDGKSDEAQRDEREDDVPGVVEDAHRDVPAR